MGHPPKERKAIQSFGFAEDEPRRRAFPFVGGDRFRAEKRSPDCGISLWHAKFCAISSSISDFREFGDEYSSGSGRKIAPRERHPQCSGVGYSQSITLSLAALIGSALA